MIDNDLRWTSQARFSMSRGDPSKPHKSWSSSRPGRTSPTFNDVIRLDSDAQGRFLIKGVYPVNQKYEVLVAAVAKNRALTSVSSW